MVAALAVAAVLVTHGIDIPTAKRAIAARTPNIEVSVTDCQRTRVMTRCSVAATLEETGPGLPPRRRVLKWVDDVYVRGHRLFVVEVPVRS